MEELEPSYGIPDRRGCPVIGLSFMAMESQSQQEFKTWNCHCFHCGKTIMLIKNRLVQVIDHEMPVNGKSTGMEIRCKFCKQDYMLVV